MVKKWRTVQLLTGFYSGNLTKGDLSENRGVDGRIILKWILKKCDGGTDWMDVALNRERWRGLWNAVMNLEVS